MKTEASNAEKALIQGVAKKDTIICSTLSCREMRFEVYLFF